MPDTIRYRKPDTQDADPGVVEEIVDSEGYHYPAQVNQTVTIPAIDTITVPGGVLVDDSEQTAVI